MVVFVCQVKIRHDRGQAKEERMKVGARKKRVER
jgi:hypothetical protein